MIKTGQGLMPQTISQRKLIISVIIFGILLASLAGSLILVRQRQELRKRAAGEGPPTISLKPAQEQIEIFAGLPVEIIFNTNNLLITKIAVRLVYQHQEEDSQIKFDTGRSSFDSGMIAAGWSCPVMTTSDETSGSFKKVVLDLECQIEAGHSTVSDTPLAKILLRTSNLPQVNPAKIDFDPTRSYVISKEENQQVAFQILNNGVYEVVECLGCTPTPTPPTTSTPPPDGQGDGSLPTSTPTPLPTLPGGTTPTPTTPGGTTPTPTVAGGAGSTTTQTGFSEKTPVTSTSLPTFSILTTGGIIFLFGILLLI